MLQKTFFTRLFRARNGRKETRLDGLVVPTFGGRWFLWKGMDFGSFLLLLSYLEADLLSTCFASVALWRQFWTSFCHGLFRGGICISSSRPVVAGNAI